MLMSVWCWPIHAKMEQLVQTFMGATLVAALKAGKELTVPSTQMTALFH